MHRGPLEEPGLAAQPTELLDGDEMVVVAVNFAGTRCPGRAGDRTADLRMCGEQLPDHGAFANPRRAGDYQQDALTIQQETTVKRRSNRPTGTTGRNRSSVP